MSALVHRRDSLAGITGSYLSPDSGYFVNVYPQAGVVNGNQSGTTITLYQGHGIPVGGGKVARFSAGLYISGSYVTASSSTGTTVVLPGSQTVLDGDLFVYIGADTGSSTPNWDASTQSIYSVPNTASAITASKLTADSGGEFKYWVRDVAHTLIVRSGTTILDTKQVTPLNGDDPNIVFAHEYAASGSGTAADPWPGACITSAIAALPTDGVSGRGQVRCISGVYNLGSGTTGIVIDAAGAGFISGLEIEGDAPGNLQLSAVTASKYDGTIFTYSGTGAALKLGNFTGSTYWMDQCKIRKIKFMQTGSLGTGIGILARLYRRGLFEDLTFTEFSTGIAMASVSDFNEFRRVRASDCRAYGVDLARITDETGASLASPSGQCNGNRFLTCDFLNVNTGTGYTNWGIRIDANSIKCTVRDSEFHNFDTSGYGAITINSAVSGPTNSVTVDANYIEHCYTGCYYNNPFGSGTNSDQQAFSFTNNYVTQITGYGVWADSSNTGPSEGITITGNTFTVPSSSAPYNNARAINLGTQTQGLCITANSFAVGGTLGALPGGNLNHGSLGAVSQNNLIIGSMRFNSALQFDSTLTVTGVATVNNDLVPRRIKLTGGTSIGSGDCALGAGWGNTASIAFTGGNCKDSRFDLTVTANGTGLSTTGTSITITFKDGTFTSAPFAVLMHNGGSIMTGTAIWTWSSTATQLILTYTTAVAPTAGQTFKVSGIVLG